MLHRRCLPFPLAGRPFHRFRTGGLDVTNVSWPCPVGRFVSAPLPSFSACPVGDCNSTCGRSFLRPSLGPEATHQHASPREDVFVKPIKVIADESLISGAFASLMGTLSPNPKGGEGATGKKPSINGVETLRHGQTGLLSGFQTYLALLVAACTTSQQHVF